MKVLYTVPARKPPKWMWWLSVFIVLSLQAGIYVTAPSLEVACWRFITIALLFPPVGAVVFFWWESLSWSCNCFGTGIAASGPGPN